MKKYLHVANRLAAIAMTSAGFLLGGCETSDDPDTSGLDDYFANHPYVTDPRNSPQGTIAISPSKANISFVGQTVAFSGVGGEGPFSWDVVYPSRGALEVRGWSQALYTALELAPNTVICYDSSGHSAVAQIDPGANTNGPAIALSVSPGSATLANFGDSVTLTASGGTAPYTWAVGNLALGGLSASSGGTVIYTRSLSGNNVVICMDSAGGNRQAPISQP